MLAASPARAAAGDLDTAFGTGGVVTGPIGEASSVAVQGDGKVLAAGTAPGFVGHRGGFLLARYNPDGTPDLTFGTKGAVTTTRFRGDFFEYQMGRALAIQADGRILMAGIAFVELPPNAPPPPPNFERYADFALARYNPDGTLDTSFGGDGKVTTDFDARVGGGDELTPGYPGDASFEEANALAIQPDGKIVAAGRGSGVDSGSDFALARYNPDGTLDASFGGDGTLTTDLGGTASDVAHALAIEPGGKIVAAGWSRVGDSADFALARYNPDGTLDTSFGGDGTLTTDFAGGYDESAALALQGDKVVVAGRTQVPSMFPYDPQYNPGDFALARYNPDGTLDASFGGDGTVTTDIGAGSGDAATALAVDPEGRLVAGGGSTALKIGSPARFALARYSPDGALDPAFGKGGAVTLDIGDDLDYIQALTFHGGKILALGVSVEDLAEFALARFETIDAGAAPAELKVEMTVPPEPPTAGAMLTYSIAVTNAGPGAAFEVRLEAALPQRAVFLSAEPTLGTCVHSERVVTCRLASLAPGAEATVEVVVVPAV
ncbi:MAG: hypothetical protein ACRD0D_07255, partial [Acidimicrobiales bacterium]